MTPRRKARESTRQLDLVHEDRTFRQTSWRGRDAWGGRCLRCDALLLLELDGTPISGIGTVELGDPPVRALVCAQCGELSRALLHRPEGDRRREELLTKLTTRLAERRREDA